MLRQILTFFVFAGICGVISFSAHATTCPSGSSPPLCSVDSIPATDLTIGSGGNLAMTVDKTSGQTTVALPMKLGQDSSATDCTATQNVGAIRYNPTAHTFEGCNGSQWGLMGTPGVTIFFTAPLCTSCGSMGSNSSETSYTIPLGSYVTPLPADTSYQIGCTLTTNGNGAAVNIQNKTTSSFVVTVNNSYTNYDNTPDMSVDCIYHHS